MAKNDLSKGKAYKTGLKNFFEWLAIICTISGLIMAFYFGLREPKSTGCDDVIEVFKYTFIALSGITLGIAIMAIFFSFRNGKLLEEKREFERLERKLKNIEGERKQIASMLHNIAHDSRDLFRDMSDIQSFWCIGTEEERVELRKWTEEIDGLFGDYCKDLVNNTKNLFDILTKDECSVSIKLFSLDEEDDNRIENTEVVTFLRDSVSNRKRSRVDRTMPTYLASGNTAFREIIFGENRSYYFCNDLRNRDGYDNVNAKWQDYYNGCLVSALVAGYDEELYTVMGALCVDNFKGNFDGELTHNTLASISDTFSMLLYEYYSMHDLVN